jgi:hypothetical protein
MKMRSRCTRKWTAGFLSVVGAVVLAMGLLSAGAFAAPNPGPAGDGPQSANVPYVAWIGEHVRLVACDPVINSTIQFANYAVEDWSGYQFQPPSPDGEAGNNIGQIFDPGPAAFFTSSQPEHEIGDGGHEGCVATDYKSLNPGLARIRLVIRNQETDEIVYSHQFLVIWLKLGNLNMQEASASGNAGETFQSQLSGEGSGNFSHYLGDPSGDGVFSPSPFNPSPSFNEEKGLIQIKVTGSFPVVKEAPLSNVLTEPEYTLPEAWPVLAEKLASASEETEPPGSNPGLWDIHGSPTNGGTFNESTTEGPLKAHYLRDAFGNFTSGENATIGPFDSEAADETLLSNGEINADDAPMPAMRVDVKLAKNEGGSDIGGVGEIEGASKALLYSHNFNGNAEEGGNLYNPYYGAYIPATDRPVSEASGVTGPSPGGDFPGFLNSHPEPYTYWHPVRQTEPRGEGSPTGCLRRAPGKSTDATPEDDYFTPGGGFMEKTFYTDERGELYVTYTPGDGFYFERLGLNVDTNNGCELAPLYEKEIGHSEISARAIYPYEPVDYQPISAGPVVKTVKSLWKKETYEFPKGTTTPDENVRLLVAKAQDIDGNPIVGEEVCFNATANSGIKGFDGSIVDTEGLLFGSPGETVSLSGSTVLDPADEGSDHLCETTNSRGLAGIEVTNSAETSVDVTTHFENEGITRDSLFPFTGNAAGKAKEAKEAEEKKLKEEEAKKAKEEAETRTKAQEEKENERRTNEAEAENNRRKAQAEAEKTLHEKEASEAKTTEEREAIEKKSKQEEEAASKARTEAAEAEKRQQEREAAAEKRKHEEEVAAASAKAAPQLVPAAPGPALGVDGFKAKGHKAHAASKHKKHKAKKSKKKK